MIARFLLCLLLCLPLMSSLVWAQGQLINGNRTLAGTLNAATTTGSANAYILTLNPAITAYVPNQCFTFRANFTNTGSATLNVNGAGSSTLKKYVSGAQVNLSAGDIANGQTVLACYDGSTMQLVGSMGAIPPPTALAADGTDCPVGQTARGVDASGNAQGCTPVGSTGTIIATEVDGTPTGTFSTLKFSNGTLTNNGDGSATIVTGGAAGGGDFSSNTSSSVDNEVVLFSGTGGKTGKRATLSTPVVKSTAGVLGAAIAGTDFQPPLGFTPENTANKSSASALGASNLLFPTQGAVKLYVDSGQKSLSNTAIVRRGCTAGPGSPISVNADNLSGCDFVVIASLTGPTTFSAPGGTHVDGQMLQLLLTTTTAQTLTFATGTNGFAAGFDQALPTLSRDAGTVIYTFRWNAATALWDYLTGSQTTTRGVLGEVLTSNGPTAEPSWQASGPFSTADLTDGAGLVFLTPAQTLSNKRVLPRTTIAADTATIATNTDTTAMVIIPALSQATSILNPSGTPMDGEFLIYRITTTTARALTWGSDFAASYGQTLPTTTTGGGVTDEFGFRRITTAGKWGFLATSQPPARLGSIQLNPNSVKFPTTDPALLDNSENNSRLIFDNIISQCVWWQFVMPTDYAGSPVFQATTSAVSVTTGSFHIDVVVAVCTDNNDDCNTHPYGSANAIHDAAIPTTAGFTHTLSVALTNNDGLAAGKFTKIKICRGVGSDDAAGPTEVIGALLTYTRN